MYRQPLVACILVCVLLQLQKKVSHIGSMERKTQHNENIGKKRTFFIYIIYFCFYNLISDKYDLVTFQNNIAKIYTNKSVLIYTIFNYKKYYNI